MNPTHKKPSSGITVIIVGAGFAGLTAAIECDRKGHSVILFDKVPEIKALGDIISFSTNSTKFFERWPGVAEKLEKIAHQSDHLDLNDWNGNFITSQSWEKEAVWGTRINGHRGQIIQIVYQHALEQGIDIKLGQDVTDYFETETEAGIVANGKRYTADVVFAAEGVRSRGRKIVLGFEDKPNPSGYAVYRAWYSADELAKNERTKYLVENGDIHIGWVGPDVHFLAATLKGGKEANWVCTHKDNEDIEESWQFPARVEDALKVVEGWDPVVQDLIKLTPSDRLFDYKLVYRDPLPTFISPKARIALIGDAAHPFLPTSIQGASQAMEDGVTLAICLEKSGKRKVQEAVRAYEKIRYDRVHKAQETGVSTRDRWHKADWDYIRKNPESLHLRREEWLLNFDAEAHAYSVYDDIVASFAHSPSRSSYSPKHLPTTEQLTKEVDLMA
ncbi:putative salicylate hydroxylase [Phaeomoniella chlamydospora]|uniref:Putative salicylate hydroxylase n=1 Tax=Phaeomoniella chlamydospora TaxID=158046 RepID=A0A0G2EX91_PHACM|nr:putative salicylate hydroxylase [Phaeomoniella chlamydospora]